MFFFPVWQSKVEIDPAMQRDAGYYECQAYNRHAVETKVSLTCFTLKNFRAGFPGQV